MLLDGVDVTDDCSITYDGNVNVGKGTASVTAHFDDGSEQGLTAREYFDIMDPEGNSDSQTSEQPVEESDEQPAEQPEQTPSETPDEKPSEQPEQTPAETPSEKPAEQPAEQPSETPDERTPLAGDLFESKGATYRIISAKAATAAYHKAPASATDVSIPKSVKLDGRTYRVERIDRAAFTGSSVQTVKMASSVKAIDKRAFYRADKLRSAVVGSGVMVVAKQAFARCARLSSLTLGKSVVTLGQSAFSGSPRLKALVVKSPLLTKRTAAKCLAGSKVVSVKTKVAGKAKRVRCVKAYRAIFTKPIAGRTAKVS